MKAILYHTYGSPDVLRCEEVGKPAPGDDEVLVTVRAASVNPYDWHYMRGAPSVIRVMAGLRRPTVPRLGVDVAGRVESVGGSVTLFKPGDEVFGMCRGAFAEYACVSESSCVAKPSNATFEQSAAVPLAALTALQGLRVKGRTQPGRRVLINGASGGVGTFAVQIAKSLGADVTGVCSTANVEMVRSIGADRVVDYTREDFTLGAHRYDLIIDCVGNRSLPACRRVLSRDGVCVIVGVAPGTSWNILTRALNAAVLSRFGSQTFVMFGAKRSREDLTVLRDLLEAGKITPVIDRRYPLNEVPQAMRYLEQGHARGKVVISVEHT